jgi:uncharacterized protein (DUF1697 family)
LKYVALLRGINVGGKNTIAMKELKACFERQGFGDVSTYINSGNIIFTTSAPESGLVTTIEACIKTEFDLDIPVVVCSQQEIAATAQKIPQKWVNDKTMRTDVLFLWPEADRADVLNEIKINPAVDNVLYVPGSIIWNYDRVNYTKTAMRYFIGTKIYKQMTARNVNTVRKLSKMME